MLSSIAEQDKKAELLKKEIINKKTDLAKKYKELQKNNHLNDNDLNDDYASYFNNEIKEVVGKGVDLLFCNIEEAELFTGFKGMEEIKQAITSIASEFIITKGAEGAIVFDSSIYHTIEPIFTKAIDTTGAGDVFAGAFLYGITHGMSHPEAGKLASAASSKVVSKYGPRLNQEHIKEILVAITQAQ